jgi:hypothetical protein
MNITFTKRENSTVWICDQDADVWIWLPCDKQTFQVLRRVKGGYQGYCGSASELLKKGIRSRKNAEKFATKVIKDSQR